MLIYTLNLFKKFIFKRRIFHTDEDGALSTNRCCVLINHGFEKYIYIFIESRAQASFVTKIPVSTLFAMAIAVSPVNF